MSHDQNTTPEERELERQRRIREGEQELERRRLQKSGAPQSGMVDTSDTEYED